MCRNIVTDEHVYLLSKNNFYRNRLYFNQVKKQLLKNSCLDYKSVLIINELFLFFNSCVTTYLLFRK